jgi:hypothetical protein
VIGKTNVSFSFYALPGHVEAGGIITFGVYEDANCNVYLWQSGSGPDKAWHTPPFNGSVDRFRRRPLARSLWSTQAENLRNELSEHYKAARYP